MTNTEINTERFERLVKRGGLALSAYGQESVRLWLLDGLDLTDDEIVFLATRGLRPGASVMDHDIIAAFRCATLHAAGEDVGLG